LLSAEGSDWFWWYGDDFITENAAEFDFLFRDRLIRAAALLGEAAPARLHEPISGQARDRGSLGMGLQLPTGFIHPPVDGRYSSGMRWMGAGTLIPRGGEGAMFKSTRVVTALRFGCDLERLYLRVENSEPLEGATLHLSLTGGEGKERSVDVPLRKGALKVTLPGAAGSLDQALDLSLPLKALHLKANDRIQLELRLERNGVELDRVPSRAALAFEVPGSDFEERLWFI
jgi:hypothetical protein